MVFIATAFRLSLKTPANGTSTTSGVRTDRAETLHAGQYQVKATQASIPSCVLGDEPNQQVLFQNGEAGFWGRLFLPADQCAILHEAQGCLSAALQQLPQHCQ